MLSDTTTSVQGHGNIQGEGQNQSQCQIQTQNQPSVLKPLRIVKRTQNTRTNGQRTKHMTISTGNTHASHSETQKNQSLSGKRRFSPVISSSTDIPCSSSVPKMSEYPNYRFNKIIQEESDMLFPFYRSGLKTENVHLRNNEPKLDFSNDITFFKNVTKKYKRPMVFKYIKIADVTGTKRSCKNVFNDACGAPDPILACFTHMKHENNLRFGDNLITVNLNGSYEMKHSPVQPVTLSNDDEDDEVLYHSDEGECSRLENSDLDDSTEKDSDLDLDLGSDIDIDVDASVEGDDNDDSHFDIAEDSILNSSMISQGMPTFLDALHGKGIRTPNGSPSKRVHTSTEPSRSPVKQETLLRTLKGKISPIKTLQNHRAGHINKSNGNESSKPIKFNYAKWDNSMTISAKAIMKMVDDSLVSSDTEMYNQTCSFLAMKAGKSGAVSGLGKEVQIDAADLMDALNDEETEGPESADLAHYMQSMKINE
jgi:hypothetical protein